MAAKAAMTILRNQVAYDALAKTPRQIERSEDLIENAY